MLAVRQGRVGLEAGQGSFGVPMDGEDVRQTMRGLVEQGELSLDPIYRRGGLVVQAIARHDPLARSSQQQRSTIDQLTRYEIREYARQSHASGV